MATTTALRIIDAKELQLKLTSAGQRPVLINALSRESYAAKHIPGSINIPVEKADMVSDVIPNKEEEIIVYCANADCDASPKLAQRFEELGYNNVIDFEEGLAGWKNAGYELTGQDI